MAKTQHEWTAKDWENLQNGKRILHDALPIIDKVEACGVDCQAWREIHREILNRFDMIESNFMPTKPRS